MLLVINEEQEMESRETPSAQKLACGEWGFFLYFWPFYLIFEKINTVNFF
jgi:hypothetical protein